MKGRLKNKQSNPQTQSEQELVPLFGVPLPNIKYVYVAPDSSHAP